MHFPPFLQPGDTVAILNPARSITENELAPALASLEAWGLKPILAPNAMAVHHQYAGTDAQRLADIQWAIMQEEVKAVICGRGGYGSLRIVDGIDWKAFRKHPKWWIGFSDITSMHIGAIQAGLASIHGPMCISWNGKTSDESGRDMLRRLLFGQLPSFSYLPDPSQGLKTGKARGRLIGGNLSILSQLIGTKTDFDTDGCILFLEDLDEYLYHIDRMMQHLKRAGKLEKLKGLVLGGFTDLKDNDTPFGMQAHEIVMDALGDLEIPVCSHFPTGHWPRNFPLVQGAMATLSVSHSLVEMKLELV